jgi:NAD(P)H-nitrite reductase large subunit
MRRKRILRQVIIGNSAAGLAAATAIRRQDPFGLLTIISEEGCPAYSRVLTTYFLKGKIDRGQLQYCDLSFYGERNIQPFLGHRAMAIDVQRQRVILDRGKPIPYDNLLIATGASPTFPSVPGMDHRGVFGLRTIADAEEIHAWCEKVREIVILGAGLVSLQVADALLPRNLKITLIVKSSQVLSQLLDPGGASLIEGAMKQRGIRILKGRDVQEIRCDSNGSVCEVLLDDDQSIPAQMVVVGKGVQPNIDLLEGTGIHTKSGILVDEQMRTNIHHIYAAGDVAEGIDFLTGERKVSAIWPTAAAQGEIAGLNMTGFPSRYDGFISRNVTHLFGLETAVLGLARARGQPFDIGTHSDPEGKVYRRLVLEEGRLVGASLIGRIRDAGILHSLIRTRRVLGPLTNQSIRFPLNWGRFLTGR